MTLVNCKDCGRLFNRIVKDICPDCVKQDEHDFLKVNDYLRDHRGASPQEVHEQTEVALSKIFAYIREGRLVVKNYPEMTYPCERCQTPIQAGRFCRPCTNEMKQEFNRVVQQDKQEQDNKIKAKDEFDYHIKNRFERK